MAIVHISFTSQWLFLNLFSRLRSTPGLFTSHLTSNQCVRKTKNAGTTNSIDIVTVYIAKCYRQVLALILFQRKIQRQIFHGKKHILKCSFLYYEPCQSDKFQQMNFISKFTCIGVNFPSNMNFLERQEPKKCVVHETFKILVSQYCFTFLFSTVKSRSKKSFLSLLYYGNLRTNTFFLQT